MVSQCFVCKTYNKGSYGRSFHRFPRDPVKLRLWLSILGIDVNVVVPNSARICSDHFSLQDFIERPSGIKLLRVSAVPAIASTSTCYKSPNPSESSDFDDGDKENYGGALNVRDQTVEEEKSKFQVKPLEQSPAASSSTLTASSPSGLGSTSELEISQSPQKKRKLLQPRYLGDCSTSDLSSPTRAKRNWGIAKRTVIEQRKKIRQLAQIQRRLKARIVCLKSLLGYLRDNHYITESAETIIQESLPGVAADIMKRILKGPSHQKYNPSLRSFAMTLHFYSPKAYNFVREKFNNSLPHPTTISKWYQCVDGKPGFTIESLQAIKIKVLEAESKGKLLLGNLVMDEVQIMRKVEWTGQQFSGYINIGTNVDSDNIPEATEALVFMVVALNGNWKITVGYFFIHGLTGLEKANLVNNCLEFLSKSGVKITSITFDGAMSNITMMKCLGACINNVAALKTYFLHPVNNEKVYMYLDPSHLLKLIRAFLGSQHEIRNGNGQKLEWQYLQNLVDLQDEEGLHAATKIRKRHMGWAREKMKVKIAAQTLSKSVADALMFLCSDLKLDAFKGAEATAEFVLLFNNLFDIFNSKNKFAKYEFKKALSPETEASIFSYLDHCKTYICSLTVKSQSVVSCPRKTGFLGFLICIESLKCMYQDLVNAETALLKFISTYKLSQDHLEIYFSAMRSRCGSNNNPTARIFESNYKKLLVHSEIKGSDYANALALDSTAILFCSSSKITKNDQGQDLLESVDYLRLSEELNDHDYIASSAWHLTDYSKDVVIYIAGFIVRKLKKCVNCTKCLEIISTADPLHVSLLQKRKQYGNLTFASNLVIQVCQAAEHFVRLLSIKSSPGNRNFANVKTCLVNTCMRNLATSVYDSFGDHRYDCAPLDDHSIHVVKLILEKYIELRIHHITKQLQPADRVRSVLTKTILFKNQ